MASIIEELDGLARIAWRKEWHNPAWRQFLLSGDTKLLNSIPRFNQYSYTYDEPRDEQDARLVPFGAVPPIAFSEAMGDLARIAGKDNNSTGETKEQS